MSARRAGSIVVAAAVILATGMSAFGGDDGAQKPIAQKPEAGVAQQAQTPAGQKPQVVSSLGKSFFAKADTDGAIAKADAALAADPKNLDLLIAAARAHDVALQFDQSIALYTKAIDQAPNDVRAYRFRGHRYISTRKFDLAIKDLERGLALAPSSYDVIYHLGLAYFMTAQYPAAASTYRACLERKTPGPKLPEGWIDCAALTGNVTPAPAGRGGAGQSTAATPPPAAAPSSSEDLRMGITDWMYRSLRRAGRDGEAMVLVAGVPDGLTLKQDVSYYQALLFYRGLRTEAQVLPAEAFKENTGVSVGYGLVNFYLAEGQTAKACALMRRISQDDAHWNAFGYIGAETELARANGPCAAPKK